MTQLSHLSKAAISVLSYVFEAKILDGNKKDPRLTAISPKLFQVWKHVFVSQCGGGGV